MSQADCSRALKSLEILINAVVTIVVSRAERKRQSHSQAMIVGNLLELMGTTGMPLGVSSLAAWLTASRAIVFVDKKDHCSFHSST
jgi:hypothetical protein